MADNLAVTPGTGATVAMDELVDGTLGTVKVQYVKLMDGTLDSSTKAAVSANGLQVQQATAANLNATVVNAAGSAIMGKVGIDQTTPGTTNGVQVNAALPAGTNVIGHVIVDTAPSTAVTNAGTFAVQVSNANANGSATSANSAPVVIASDQAAVKTLPGVTATASGATASRVNAAATTNATSLKASAGQLYTIDVFNVAAYNVFLKLYNKASAPTVGTDTPVMTIPIQAGGGYSKTWPMGLPFATGIAYAITKLQADSDTTAVVAGDLTGNTTWI